MSLLSRLPGYGVSLVPSEYLYFNNSILKWKRSDKEKIKTKQCESPEDALLDCLVKKVSFEEESVYPNSVSESDRDGYYESWNSFSRCSF